MYPPQITTKFQTFDRDNVPPNYQKIVNVPKGWQKDKNDLRFFSIKQKYPYKFEKTKINFNFFEQKQNFFIF
jgi:hypothetical protein